MPRPKSKPTPPADPVADYRHADKRKHIPPAALASQGKVQEVAKTRYTYDPQLPPGLRFDATGAPDRLPDLLETARTRSLPFEAGQHGRIAVKVIDPRGNEVMRVMALGETRY